MRRFAVPFMLLIIAAPGLAMAQDATWPVTPAPGVQPPPGTTPPVTPDSSKTAKQDAKMQKWQQRFDAANTTHDGHLTLAQAQQAGLKPVVAHFSEIDTQNRGYVTFNQLLAWHMNNKAKQLQQQAAQLRTQD